MSWTVTCPKNTILTTRHPCRWQETWSTARAAQAAAEWHVRQWHLDRRQLALSNITMQTQMDWRPEMLGERLG